MRHHRAIAATSMKIHVRRRHIENGERGVPGSCPIALAYEATTGERPRVFSQLLYTTAREYRLPLAAQQFIARFDSGKPVKPFAFVLK